MCAILSPAKCTGHFASPTATAEAAGLVLGVVALAGLFKDCVDLFSYIKAAQAMGSEYHLLETRLDIEKTLLLRWAERVG